MSSSLSQSTGWTALFFVATTAPDLTHLVTTEKEIIQEVIPKELISDEFIPEEVHLEIARKLIGAEAIVLLKDKVHHTL